MTYKKLILIGVLFFISSRFSYCEEINLECSISGKKVGFMSKFDTVLTSSKDIIPLHNTTVVVLEEDKILSIDIDNLYESNSRHLTTRELNSSNRTTSVTNLSKLNEFNLGVSTSFPVGSTVLKDWFQLITINRSSGSLKYKEYSTHHPTNDNMVYSENIEMSGSCQKISNRNKF
jgi:hypothetical protein